MAAGTQCAFNNYGLSSALSGSFHLCLLEFNKVLIILFTFHWIVVTMSFFFNVISFLNICLLMCIPRYRLHVLFKRSACDFDQLKSVCLSIDINHFQDIIKEMWVQFLIQTTIMHMHPSAVHLAPL